MTAPIYVFIYGTMADGSPDLVPGQHNVVDVVPGEPGYSDLWQVNLVTVPDSYEADSIKSASEIQEANYEITSTNMFVNCPIVPEGSTLETGEELTQGWHEGDEVYYPDFGANPPIAAPIYVLITGMDAQGNPQFVEGQRNIINVVPGDEGYSAFWGVNLVTVPQDYAPNTLKSFEDVQASGYPVTETDMLVNCPVVEVAPPPSDAIPPEVTQFSEDWPLPQHDYSNTRATEDATINSGNVESLGIAWAVELPIGFSTFGSASTVPIIMGDTVYFQDLGNNIYAVDLETGSVKWSQIYNLENLGPNGVAVGWGKVFGTSGPYTVAAHDVDTGEQLWETALSGVETGTVGIDIQPTVYDNLVYFSTVPGSALANFYAGGGIGVLYALDQETGEIVWSFDTVDSEDIWGNPDINSGGGSWYPPAIDPVSGTIYWDIANPGPFPGISNEQDPEIEGSWPNGTSRPGPNLYTNSLVALDHESGALQWYTQVWPHDIADYDLQISPILASASIGGQQQDIAIVGGKMGWVYAINRDTGALLWGTPVGEHNENSYLSAFPTDGSSVFVVPGPLGGIETPMAYADGVVYVPVVNLGADSTGFVMDLLPFDQGTGELVAIDVETGHILWYQEFNSINVGGATVVNDLVFTGTFDGMIYAFDRDTGELVWSYKAPAGINAWPAVAGDTIVWPIAGPGGPPSVIAFRVGSTAPAVQILSPDDGSSIPAGDVTVSVAVFNLDVVNKLGQPAAPGEGHIHYYMDVEVPTTPGQPAVTAAGTYAATADTSYTWQNVPPGEHTFAVQLVNNDHTPLSPPVVAEVTVTTDNNPRVEITQPSNGEVVKSGPVTVQVSVTNFDLVNKLGQPNVPGEGHIHYYMDVEVPTTPGQPAVTAAGTYVATADTSYTWQNVPPGEHTFAVQLVNNDHTPLSPPVVAEIEIIAVTYTGGLGSQ